MGGKKIKKLMIECFYLVQSLMDLILYIFALLLLIFYARDVLEHISQELHSQLLYVCSHYPECDAYVRTHKGTKIPVGSMANQELRNLRKTAHHYFDQLYKSGYMTKDDAYYWLSSIIDAPMSKAHIGYLSEYYCKEVIEKSKEYLEVCRNKRKKADFRRGGAIAS